MKMRREQKVLLVALLCVLAATLSACGGSGAGLIPEGNAGPLRLDFEAVASAAESGNGDCAKTESELAKTEHDFETLPSSVESRLHARLAEGIERLRSQALLACKQPSDLGATTTATTGEPTLTPPPSTTTTTTTTTTSSEENVETSSSSTPPPNGGTSPETPGGHVDEGNPGGVAPEEEGEGEGKGK